MPDATVIDDPADPEQGAIVIINTRSRTARTAVGSAVALLEARGVRVRCAHAVDDPRLLAATLHAALAAHPCRLVVVGGGDGTVSELVDGLAGGGRVLGLLPLGTSNNFARTLGLPLGLEAAVEVIAAGKVADVDLGRVDDDYFTNVASAGLGVQIAARVPAWGKRHLGRLAYLITGLRVLATHAPFAATLTVDGRPHRLALHQLVIANGRFHAGRPLVTTASADDRRLVAQAMLARGRWRLVRSLGAYFAGRDRIPDTIHLTGSQMTLDCVPPQRLEIDGELKAMTPVRISVASEALNVMVPLTFVDR